MDVRDPPTIKAPWWQTLLWRAFQIAAGGSVYWAVVTANVSDKTIREDSLAPILIAVVMAFWATLMLQMLLPRVQKALTALKLRRRIGPRQ